jgi:C4-dicarboxylate-specific signal transduction histidine kinase
MASQLQNGQVQWLQPADLTSCRVRVVSDPLKQVAINVVTNALAAMQPAGGQLLVDMAPSADGRQVGVSFKDTGPGIPSELLSRRRTRSGDARRPFSQDREPTGDVKNCTATINPHES